jgi:hypothetical protein
LLEMLGLDTDRDLAMPAVDPTAPRSAHPTPRLRQPGRATRALG